MDRASNKQAPASIAARVTCAAPRGTGAVATPAAGRRACRRSDRETLNPKPYKFAAQALHDLLKATHRGYIIPPRPEKNTVEGQRASEEFVEARRANLQRYLNQLAAHPVIGQSQVDTLSRVFYACPDPPGHGLRSQDFLQEKSSVFGSVIRLEPRHVCSWPLLPVLDTSNQKP